MANLHGHICIEGTPKCSAKGCARKIYDIDTATLLLSKGKITLFCSDDCHDNTLRGYLEQKDERRRVAKAIGKRNLLKELSYRKGET